MKKTSTKTPHSSIINRLSRAEGQIHALKKMLEQNEIDCTMFITQIKAARSALLHASEEYVIGHIHTCQKLKGVERDAKITEAIKLFSKE